MRPKTKNAPSTLRALLALAQRRFHKSRLFFGHGLATARDEAAYLILHTLRLPPDALEANLDRELLPQAVELVLAVLEKRCREKIPAAYITREAWLGEHRFYVDERVVVPRSFIAELLEDRLAPWIVNPDKIDSVLDLCTGSGCLAILAALAFSRATIDAADISADALDVARRNIQDYRLTKRVHPIASNLFAGVRAREYDLIVANPPYVNAESMASLPAEYLHEPARGLAGGPDGLDCVRGILRDASQHLKPGGLLVVEIGHNRKALEAVFPRLEFTWLTTPSSEEMVFLMTRGQLAAS